jgi:DNA-binding response OmpR family regulator
VRGRELGLTPARSPILVVEADPALGAGIVEQLIADSHPAKLVQNARHATLFARRYPPSLVIIGDLNSPHAPLTLLRHIRRSDPDTCWQADVPVIMLSSSTHQADVLRAFDAGADDILARPPAYLELRARLQAILRRTGTRRAENRRLRIRSLAIDTTSREVTIGGRHIQLRRLEYDLLAYLASDPRRVFHKQELLTNLWGYATPNTTRTLDSHASRLRRKLGSDGERWITNVHGVGYRLI